MTATIGGTTREASRRPDAPLVAARPLAQRRGRPSARHGALLPLWAALVVSAGAGYLYAGAFPSAGWWPLGILAPGLMLATLVGRRAGSAFLVAGVGGAAFFLALISWTSLYLGPLPWVALSVFEALLVGVGGIAIALAYRWVPRAFPTRLGRLGLVPIAVAGLWTAREFVADTWPYGGFAWGRVALSQSNGPLAPLVAWIGLSGLTAVAVWLAAFLLELARAGWTRAPVPDAAPGGLRAGPGRAARRRSALVLPAGLAVAAVLAVPAWPAATHGTVRVTAVQGDGPAGYFEPHQQGDVMAAQASATLAVADRPTDLVLWPEGSADLDPTRDARGAAVLDYLQRRMRVPFVVGAITERGERLYNTSLVWEDGRAVAHYDKQHPVPFGEYVPDRAFWRTFAPSLIDLIGRDFTPGTTRPVVDVGDLTAGVSICFDIVDDRLASAMVADGAQVVLAQTNNADFGRTEENLQQLAIARMRAVELGRSVVNLSTVGTSQVIGPSGATIDRIPAYRPGAMVTAVPLATRVTPAALDAQGIEYLAMGVGLGALAASAPVRRSRRPRRPRAAR